MTINLSDVYQGYIGCLNSQDWDNLGNYVDTEVAYNGEMIGLVAYRQAREREFREIPDLHFKVSILVSDQKTVASRLEFDISPSGEFMGLPVDGRRVRVSENVLYEYESRRRGMAQTAPEIYFKPKLISSSAANRSPPGMIKASCLGSPSTILTPLAGC